jgi:3-oxoacyl-[acyl-carrier protein] reductase
MRLKDKVAIVTGSGRGIGEGIVLRFAGEDAKLIINDVNEADAKTVVDKIKVHPTKAYFVS